jgi:hypothetical protein
MLKAYTFPRAFTNRFYSLEELITAGTQSIVESVALGSLPTKAIISRVCADIFTRHFCSKSFDLADETFVEMVDNYDDIFYEVNQGYAADFLPFLMPFHEKNLKRINKATHKIRDFVLTHIIGSRFDDFDPNSDPDDYVDSLVKYVKSEEAPELTWDSALFALEDIIGGHSAVANFLVKLLAYLAKEPQVQSNIQDEIDRVLGGKQVTISDRPMLPYTEATIYEAIRLIASPIVPRVANCDSSIGGSSTGAFVVGPAQLIVSFRLSHRGGHRRLLEQLRPQHVRRVVGATGQVQAGKVHQRRSLRQAGPFLAVRRRQEELHGLQDGAAGQFWNSGRADAEVHDSGGLSQLYSSCGVFGLAQKHLHLHIPQEIEERIDQNRKYSQKY